MGEVDRGKYRCGRCDATFSVDERHDCPATSGEWVKDLRERMDQIELVLVGYFERRSAAWVDREQQHDPMWRAYQAVRERVLTRPERIDATTMRGDRG